MPKESVSIKRTIAREAVEKNPSASTWTLARLIFNQNKGVWDSLSAARDCVRVLRGEKTSHNHTKKVVTCPRQPIDVPAADESDWQVHSLPADVGQWLVISDLHIPYHSPKAVKKALEFGRAECCDGVLINGDFPDFYQMSRFDRNPQNRSVAGEIELCKRMLDAIEKVGAKKILYKGGNHDARLPKYAMQRCPELFAVIDIHCNISKIFGLAERGIEYIPDMNPIRHRDLTIVHGHEWGSGVFNPVNPARGAFLRSYDNVLVSHSHRTSDHAESNIRDVVITCKSIGCLCHLHPNYRALGNRWNHGFAVLTTGHGWSIKNYKILNERDIV